MPAEDKTQKAAPDGKPAQEKPTPPLDAPPPQAPANLKTPPQSEPDLKQEEDKDKNQTSSVLKDAAAGIKDELTKAWLEILAMILKGINNGDTLPDVALRGAKTFIDKLVDKMSAKDPGMGPKEETPALSKTTPKDAPVEEQAVSPTPVAPEATDTPAAPSPVMTAPPNTEKPAGVDDAAEEVVTAVADLPVATAPKPSPAPQPDTPELDDVPGPATGPS